MAAGGLEAYKVVWTFVSTGSNVTDNGLQTKSATAGFTWEIAVHPALGLVVPEPTNLELAYGATGFPVAP